MIYNLLSANKRTDYNRLFTGLQVIKNLRPKRIVGRNKTCSSVKNIVNRKILIYELKYGQEILSLVKDVMKRKQGRSYHQSLLTLKEQKARYGMSPSPRIINEIEYLEEQLSKIERTLNELGKTLANKNFQHDRPTLAFCKEVLNGNQLRL